METDRSVPVGRLILVPALITLAITVLRLTGELLDWSPRYFSKEAGGGGSLVGIAWLVPVFGIYFGMKLARMGFLPKSAWRAAGAALGGLVITIGSAMFAGALGLAPGWMLVIMSAASIAGLWVASLGWPALSGVLVAYGLAARIPVVLVMLFAILGNWGTHYDVSGPEFASVDAWPPVHKWLAIGALPQLTAWMAFTMVFGMLFGAPAAALAGRRERVAADEASPAHA